MNFGEYKDLLLETSISDWIKALSDSDLNSYEKNHPNLHDDTKKEIEAEKLLRKRPKGYVKSVTYKITKIGRKWLEGEIPGIKYKHKIQLNDTSKDWKEGETYTFNAEIVKEYSKYGTSTTIYPITQEVKKTIDQQNNRKEIEKWLGYIENAVKSGYLYKNGVEKVKLLGIDKFSDLQNILNGYIEDVKKIEREKAEKKKTEISYGQSWVESYGGKKCFICNQAISKGELVRYQYQNGNKNITHVNCKDAIEKAKKEAEDTTKYFSIGGGSGYGYQEYHEGQIVKATQDQINRGYPEFLYVVSSSKKYYRDDGMSFGVGDESGYVYSAKCREATEDESKKLREELEKSKKIRKAKLRVEEIKSTIRKTGEKPDGNNKVEGLKLFDTQNIYGSGDWFVITKDYIWYVENHGMDGDNWSANNVLTGGAGAIGWRIKIDEKLVSELKELEKIIISNHDGLI